MVAQAPQQLVARQAAPQLGARGAAAGHDEPLRLVALAVLILQPEARRGLLHGGDLRAGEKADVPPGQGEAEHVHHGIGLVGPGIDPSAALRDGVEPQGLEEVQHRVHRVGLQGRADEIGIGAVVAAGMGLAVGEIAAAVPGGQQLAAHPGLALKEQDLVGPRGRRRNGRRHPGGPRADNRDVHAWPPFLFSLYYKRKIRL